MQIVTIKKSYILFLITLFISFFNCSVDSNNKLLTASNTNTRLFHSTNVIIPKYDKTPFRKLYLKKKYEKIILLAGKQKKSLSLKYIIGMSYFHLKKYTKSIIYLKPLLKTNLPIKEWLYYHLGVSYHFIGNKKLCIYYLEKLRTKYPHSYFMVDAIEVEGKILIAQKSYNQLIKNFLSYKPSKKDFEYDERYSYPAYKNIYAKLMERVYYFIGMAYLKTKNFDMTKYWLEKVINLYSKKYTKKAIYGLSLINKNFEKNLSPNALTLLCNYYYKRKTNKQNKKNDYQIIIKLLSPLKNINDKNINIKILLLLARTHNKINNKELSHSLFKEIFTIPLPKSKDYQESQYYYAKFLERIDIKKSHSVYKTILSTQNHAFLVKTYKKYLRLFYSKNNIKLILKTAFSLNKYKDIDKILFKWLNQKKYVDIIKVFPGLIRYCKNNKYAIKILYWLGKSAKELGKKKLAISYFKKAYLKYKRDYYTYNSLIELKKLLDKNPEKLRLIYKQDKKNYNNFLSSYAFKSRIFKLKQNFDFNNIKSSLFRTAFYLMAMGETWEGYKYFLRFRHKIRHIEKQYYLVMAEMFYKLGLTQYTIRFSDFTIKYLNGYNNHNYLYDSLAKISYPLYFKDIIFETAQRYNIDPYLILAVIREESRFFSEATSFSGAMGLMQLMPSTGLSLLPGSKKTKNANFYDEMLNISLGTKYISRLLKNNTLTITIAGYNGGPSRVRRLLKKIKKQVNLIDEEHFVELIPIDETKNYVKKVLSAYYNYIEIYE